MYRIQLPFSFNPVLSYRSITFFDLLNLSQCQFVLQLKIWKETHHLSKGHRKEQDGFLDRPADSLVKIQVLWGLKENDRSECKASDIECDGKVVFDDDFDPNPVENQQALMVFMFIVVIICSKKGFICETYL